MHAYKRWRVVVGTLVTALVPRDPQQVKPGNAMPKLNIREQDLRDIAAYLARLDEE